MRWLTLFVLLLATATIYSDEDVKTGDDTEETEGSEELEEEDWENDGVMLLTADNFETFIDENEFVLVEFYAPWCGHCKSFAPEYAKVANQLEEQSSPIKVVKVDATKDEKYTDNYGVRGYPTLQLFRNGASSEYWGVKQVSSIVDWLKKKTGPAAIEIENVADAEEFINSKDVVIIGFFKDSESEQAKAFLSAADSVDDYLFGITSNENVYQKYDAESGSIILFKNFDEAKSTFEGEWTEKAIREFVAINAAPLVIDFNRNFGHVVFSVVQNHLLIFISKEQGHVEKYIQPAKDVARQFRGKVVFVAIDSDSEDYRNILSFFNLKKEDSPAMRLIHESNNKYKPTNGDLSPESVRSFVQDVIDGKLKVDLKSQILPEDWDKSPVKTLVGTNFEEVVFDTNKDVFVAFYSPWSDDFKELTTIFDELGEKYKDSETVVIAKMDATANELDTKHPKIFSIPTLTFYKKGDNSVACYAGKKTLDGFVKFIESGGEEQDDDDDNKEEKEEEGEVVEEEEEEDELSEDRDEL